MLIHKTIQYGVHVLDVSGYYHPVKPASEDIPGEPELFEPESVTGYRSDYEMIDLLSDEIISDIINLVLEQCHEPSY